MSHTKIEWAVNCPVCRDLQPRDCPGCGSPQFLCVANDNFDDALVTEFNAIEFD